MGQIDKEKKIHKSLVPGKEKDDVILKCRDAIQTQLTSIQEQNERVISLIDSLVKIDDEKLRLFCQDFNYTRDLARTVEAEFKVNMENRNFEKYAGDIIIHLIAVYNYIFNAINSIEAEIADINGENLNKEDKIAAKYLQPILDSIVENLEENEIQVQISHPNDTYTAHRALNAKYEITADKLLNNVIKESTKPGFFSKTKVYSKEEIIVWKYEHPDNESNSSDKI
ncbi:MAG: hypothetical protein LBM93_13805 [Oscillospiraceae bacterium]|jgi:hypothetical protein|nr:hypothetical protein [Oscillospiraceae bacterium]